MSSAAVLEAPAAPIVSPTRPRTMMALAKPRPGVGAEVIEAPVPEVGPNDVLVKVAATGVCGTDQHIYNWDDWAASRIKTPLVFGHEFSGYVAEVGENVRGLEIGQYVSGEGHIGCGWCRNCRTGQMHICDHVDIIGVDIPGCFAEYVKLPAANVWPLRPEIPVEIGAIHDPLGNAVHTALAAELTGNLVVILGCGAIGLFAVPIAHMGGATRVVAVDVNPYRLELARKVGADTVIDARDQDPVALTREMSEGVGVDVVLEMSGNSRAIKQGFQMLRNGGTFCLLGIPARPVELDLARDIIFKGINLLGINGRQMFHTWYQMDSLLKAGLNVEPIITHRFALERALDAFELINSGQCGKVVLYPGGQIPPQAGR